MSIQQIRDAQRYKQDKELKVEVKNFLPTNVIDARETLYDCLVTEVIDEYEQLGKSKRLDPKKFHLPIDTKFEIADGISLSSNNPEYWRKRLIVDFCDLNFKRKHDYKLIYIEKLVGKRFEQCGSTEEYDELELFMKAYGHRVRRLCITSLIPSTDGLYLNLNSFSSYLSNVTVLKISYRSNDFRYSAISELIKPTERDLKNLAMFLTSSNVTDLAITNSQIDDNALRALSEFKSVGKIECLDLSENNLQILCPNVLIDILKICEDAHDIRQGKKLNMINLSNNRIMRKGLLILLLAIQNYSTIVDLNLSCNKIGDDGFLILSKCVCDNRTLKVLRLRKIGLSRASVKYIMAVIVSECPLVIFDFSLNNLDIAGVSALAQLLSENIVNMKHLTLISYGLCENEEVQTKFERVKRLYFGAD